MESYFCLGYLVNLEPGVEGPLLVIELDFPKKDCMHFRITRCC